MYEALVVLIASAFAFLAGFGVCRAVDRSSKTVRFARQATDSLRSVTDEISRDVARHSHGVREAESRLRNRDAGIEDLARCAKEILDANADLRQRLGEAQDQLAVQTKLLCQHVHEARQDALTGLHNRLALDEYLEERVAAGRRGEATALLTIDVDHFKGVNDRYGHLAGDAALKSVAAAISAAAPPDAFVARYGGEEIFVCLPGIQATEAFSVAEDIRAAVGEPLIRHRGDRFRVTASAGLACATDFASASEWVEAADRGLYLAKASGRDRGMALVGGVYRLFSESSLPAKTAPLETDAATGLPTRKAFTQELEGRPTPTDEPARHGCLLSIRLTALDAVIANKGYRTADAALRAVATAISECLRPEDLATKWDLKTFAVYVSDADERAAETVAERIERRLAQTLSQRIDTTVELGATRGCVRLHAGARLEQAIAESQQTAVGCCLSA